MIPRFFLRLFRSRSSLPPPSNVQAKKRLQLALLYDKLDISDEMIQSLQKDLVGVLSKYFEIDHKALRLEITQEEEGMSALVMNTRILSAKRVVQADASDESPAPRAVEKEEAPPPAVKAEEAPAVAAPPKNGGKGKKKKQGLLNNV